MSEEKLNLKFDIPLSAIEEIIDAHINGDFSGYDRVVSPRDLAEVRGMCFFKKEAFYRLIRNIGLKNNPAARPYKDARIKVIGADPHGLSVGQTFVMQEKIMSLLKLRKEVFGEFVVKGISKMPPAQMYGIDYQGRKALAFYIPPIVEIHGEQIAILDGIHRSKLCDGAGTTVNAVHISNVAYPLPFEPISWEETSIVSEKPPIEKRYKGLRREYFRDLAVVGIDG